MSPGSLGAWGRPALTSEHDLLIPVAGSVHASLAVWLWEAGLLPADGGVARFQAEQGEFLGRPGRLQVELHLANGRPAGVRVGGRAVTVLSGTLRLG